MTVFTAENLHADDFAAACIIHALRCVAHVFCLFAKNRAQQPFFRTKLLFTFRRNFPDKHIARFHFRADLHDTIFIQMAQTVFAHIWNIARHDFRAKLRFAYFYRIIFDIYARECVILD